ncbi:hypothetical protein GC163_07640 [bacterium]|nr:hypothetical protein [bacterium]
MPAQRGNAVQRSGQVKAPEANQKIVLTKANATYRFFNTSKKPFKISVRRGVSSELLQDIDLFPKCSIDIRLTGPCYVVLKGGTWTLENGAAVTTDLSDIQCVYDVISDSIPVRSGQFKKPKKYQGQASVKIANIGLNISSGMYRIFNAGETPILIGTSTDPLPPACSRDVNVLDLVDVSSPDAANLVIQSEVPENDFVGLFDVLETGASVRSGRFELFEADPANVHLLINAENYSDTPYRYRLFNTGTEAFEVLADGASLVKLDKNQSIDFQVKDGAQFVKKLGVKPLAAGQTITGVYDIIGVR